MNGVLSRTLCLLAIGLLVPACGDEGDSIVQQIATAAGAPSGSLVVLGQDNELYFVSPASPGTIQGSVDVWGLSTGTTLLNISYRPATGDLYGRGSDGSLYRISTVNGFATPVSYFPFAITGTYVGMDFSAVADEIRYVSDAERNSRVDPSNNFPSAETLLSPVGDVAACAHTNSFAGAATTTLYAIDWVSNQLLLIGGLDGLPSPNGGAVTVVGPLGVTLANVTGPPFRGTGFDISPGGTAYAALCVMDTDGSLPTDLYTINLATGAATLVGPLGARGPIRSMSIAP